MKKLRLFLLFGAFLSFSFAFQNCSAPLQEEEGTTSSSSTGTGSGGASNSFASRINFAFDVELDQVAYMSCSQLMSANFDRSTYFSFRVGGYGPSSGVGLRPQFATEMSNIPSHNHKTLLVTSPANAGAQPILSLRRADDPQSPYVMNAGGPSIGVDYSPMLGDLTSNVFADKLLTSPNTRIRHQRNGTAEGLRLEADLNVNRGFQGLETAQRKMTVDGMLLAVNYLVTSSNKSIVRAPAHYFAGTPSATQAVYGKGLQLSFKRHPASGSSPDAQPWVLNSVDEVDMETKAVTYNKMSCPTNLIFTIVDPRHLSTNPAETDSTKIYCETKADNLASLSAQDRATYERVRRSLRAEDWYIDFTRKCIVPKKNRTSEVHCYGGGPRKVEYNPAKPCVFNDPNSTVNACASFASVCLR